MISVRASGSLPDLDRRSINVDCPQCRLATQATLRDVRIGGVIICRGCKANIRLVDHLGEYQRVRRRMRDTFEQMFANFGRR